MRLYIVFTICKQWFAYSYSYILYTRYFAYSYVATAG